MKIKLSFLGAVRNVTGSRFLIEVDGLKVLVDCGLYQERDFRDRNWGPFAVPPDKIDAVLLTHAHLDHCGLLPKLVKEGFRGRIHCTPATGEIARIILLDAGHIQEEDAAYKLKRHRREGRKGPRPVVPLYTTADAERCFPLFSPVRYAKTIKIGKHARATFHDAGHVFGSSTISVNVALNGESRTILFSGDVGRKDMPILNDPAVVDHADYVLIESTYGDRLHKSSEDVQGKLAEVINATQRAGGNVVIPSFALERSQDILYHLNELRLAGKIPRDLKVFLDSPMAIRITKVFAEHPELFDKEMARRIRKQMSPFEFPGLQMTRTTEQSKAINRTDRPVVIIAGSGMCSGGRIKHHLVNNITRPESTILFVGYQAAGTLGRVILNGIEEVRIHGRTRPVRAKVAQINGFSAHADREELYQWINGLDRPPREVFVVHGESESADAFAKFLRKKSSWKVRVPDYGDQVALD
jgi:metallo-beta-lactamase family protein